MKPIKKKTAKILTIVIAVILAIGLVFTFVPFKIGNTLFASFAGNVKVAHDLKPGLYGEYVLKTTPTSEALNNGVTNIKSILSEYGYPNATVYGVNGNKVRVELAVSNANDFSAAENVLSSVSVGEFELRTGTTTDATFISGYSDVKDVKIGAAGDQTYVRIIFNSSAVSKFHSKMVAGNTIYVYLGGTLVTSFSASTSATDDLYLTFTEFDSANQFRRNVLFGSLVNLPFASDLTEINTLSATLSSAGLTADVNSSNYAKSDALVIISLALTLCVLVSVAYIAIKFRLTGALVFASLLAQTVVAFLFLQAFQLIEINLTAMLVLAMCYMFMIFSAYVYVLKINSESQNGKTMMASVESGYKKSLPINIAISVMLLVVGAILLIFNSQTVAVCGLILVIFACVNALGSLLLLPLFMKLIIALCGENSKLFGLEQKEDSNEKA